MDLNSMRDLLRSFPVIGNPGWIRRLAILLAVLLVLPSCAVRDQTPGACRLNSRTREFVPRFVLSSDVHYLQRDKRWGSDPIGGSGKPLHAVGCAICSLSMALSQHGFAYTPAELNRALKEVDAYTSKGWVWWSAIDQLTHGQVRVEILRRPTHGSINAALADGHPVLVKVAPPPMHQHWVLLVGREGHDYLMKDPLDASRTIKPLSSLNSPILAVRVVKRVVP